MTESTEERKKGDRGAARTEILAIRFDPELKKRMEVAASQEMRSVPNFVEWAVQVVLDALESKKAKEG